MADENRTGWIRWRPEIAESAAWADLAEAVEEFEPPCNEAGEECARWLKEQSLSDYPFTATWVMFHNGLVHGFFAMSSNTFTIRYLSSSEEGGDARERWPCSQIKWLCRHDQGKFLGRVIFEQAAYTAQRVTEFQGNVALVIEPFDDTIAEILESKLKFLRRADQGQLWIPLHRDADLSFAATDE